MNELLMRWWLIGLLCCWTWGSQGAVAATPGDSAPPPAPLVFTEPLPPHTFWAAGYGDATRMADGAWVSNDGKRVAFFTREPAMNDGPERTLVVKDVDTDAIVFQKVLFSQEESSQRSGSDLERLARARAREARPVLEQYQWKPLPHHELEHYDTEYLSEACYAKQLRPKRSLSVEGLKIVYQAPRVQIWSGSKKVLDRGHPSWRVRQKHCAHANPAWLSGAFVSREHGVVLLQLRFCGSEACEEPPTAFHVLRIPKDKPRAGSTSPAQASSPARAPFIGYEDERARRKSLYAVGFPAISEDGTLVALAEVLSDGERKHPNLLLTVRRPKTQELVWKLPVLEAEESSTLKSAPARAEELNTKFLERIRQANAYLGQTRWVPLKEQPLQPMVTESCQQSPAQTLQMPGLELTFHQGQLVLEQGSGSAPIDLKLAHEGSTPEATCTAPSRTFLDAAYVDQPRGVILLHLTTCGDETCPEQNGWYHALSLR
ncbi:hypothetical protein [Archangium sp.]|uniref:hypothetical protein n=1 Tax=Archangium sp. TaxID=1872627 RepID=UPI00286D4FDB|nr:hypothetical protein [Archangium sp.]